MPSQHSSLEHTLAALTPRLLRVARKFFADPEDARDVVQDAIVAGLQALDRYEGRAAVSTWFHRIVVNTALMELRRRSRQSRWIDRDVEFDAAVERCAASDASIDDALTERQRAQWLQRGLAGLPSRHREVLRLRDLDDCSVDETAAILGITPAAVRVRSHRAHRALLAAIAPTVATTAGRAGGRPTAAAGTSAA